MKTLLLVRRLSFVPSSALLLRPKLPFSPIVSLQLQRKLSSFVSERNYPIKSPEAVGFPDFSQEGKLDGVVIGCFEGESTAKLTTEGDLLNNLTNGRLKEQLDLSSHRGQAEKLTVLFGLAPKFPRVAVVGLGKPVEVTGVTKWKQSIRVAASIGARALKTKGASSIGIESFEYMKSAAEGSLLGLYNPDVLKTTNDQEGSNGRNDMDQEQRKPVHLFPFTLQNTAFIEGNRHLLCEQWKCGLIYAEAQNFSRWLAESPSNMMTPTMFAERVKERVQQLQCSSVSLAALVHEQKWAEQQQMGCFLGVAKGSAEPPKFLEMHYRHPSSHRFTSKPLVFIGKGITFDSGGISLKPSSGMGAMRGDMAGGAAVVSALLGIAALQLPVGHVIALVPLCENMPSGTALKPGDILISRSGKTVEVDDTDAEGRLILADALHYACSLNPAVIIDVATLTGAIEVALGNAAAGVFTANTQLFERMDRSGKEVGEFVWRMPLLYENYRKLLKSTIADLKNVGGRSGGACTAAAFLKEFLVPANARNWIHMDIAAVSKSDEQLGYQPKGMTGVPTRTLIQFVDSLCREPLVESPLDDNVGIEFQ